MQVQHVPVIREAQTHTHIVLEHIKQLGIHRNAVALGVYAVYDQETVIVIDMLGIAEGTSGHPAALLHERR